MLSRKSQGFAQLFANNSEKSKGQSIQSHKWLFEEINGVTHRSSDISEETQTRELSRKDLQMSPLSNGVNLHDVHEQPRKFLRILYHQKYHQVGPKGKKQFQVRESCQILQNSTDRKQADKTSAANTSYLSWKKKDILEDRDMKLGAEFQAQRTESQATEHYLQTLKTNGNCLVDFLITCDYLLLFSSIFSLSNQKCL